MKGTEKLIAVLFISVLLVYSCENKKAKIVNQQIRIEDSLAKLETRIKEYDNRIVDTMQIKEKEDSVTMMLVREAIIMQFQRNELIERYDSLERELKKY